MRTRFIFLTLLLVGCTTSSELMTDRITGHWNMQKIMMDETQDVSAEHNPEGNRFIIFKADNTFESGGDPYGKNTGRWTLDVATSELHLDSDAGEEDDSHWIVSIEGDKMSWKGTRGDFNSRFAIEHKRVAN